MQTVAWSDQLKVLAARMGGDRAVTDGQGQSLSYAQPRLNVALPLLPRNAQNKVNRKKVSQAVLKAFTLIDGPYPEYRWQ